MRGGGQGAGARVGARAGAAASAGGGGGGGGRARGRRRRHAGSGALWILGVIHFMIYPVLVHTVFAMENDGVRARHSVHISLNDPDCSCTHAIYDSKRRCH